jgi:DnaJ-class molecular chaperone
MMTQVRDPYLVLGIKRNAAAADIKRAYKALVRDNHPDRDPGNGRLEEKFKEIGAAYALLSDVRKRALFDRGDIDAAGNARGAAKPRGPEPRTSRFRSKMHDFVKRRGADAGEDASLRVRGADVSYGLSIDFMEAVQGTTKRVSMANGHRLDVQVPDGTQDGQVLRLRGQGMAGIGGAASGDALVEITVKPHPFLRREGFDVHCELVVSVPEAVLGGKIRTETIDGPVAVTVPPGSNNGTVLRLRGKGFTAATGGRGDQLIVLRIVLPDSSDKAFADFVRKWGPGAKYDPRIDRNEPADG